MSKAKRKNKDSNLREIEGIIVDTSTNLVQTNTKPVQQRHYYGSQISDNVSCYDEEKKKFKNVELFAPVIYDQEHQQKQYHKRLWVFYIKHLK